MTFIRLFRLKACIGLHPFRQKDSRLARTVQRPRCR
jgi:hypothetical protein